MKPTVKNAIRSLNQKNNNNYDAVVVNPIKNEKEYLEKCKYVIGADENESAIFSKTPLYTYDEVKAELNLLTSAYDNKKYQRDRLAEYPSIQELVVALYDADDKAEIDKKRAEIKKKYPKPE